MKTSQMKRLIGQEPRGLNIVSIVISPWSQFALLPAYQCINVFNNQETHLSLGVQIFTGAALHGLDWLNHWPQGWTCSLTLLPSSEVRLGPKLQPRNHMAVFSGEHPHPEPSHSCKLRCDVRSSWITKTLPLLRKIWVLEGLCQKPRTKTRWILYCTTTFFTEDILKMSRVKWIPGKSQGKSSWL